MSECVAPSCDRAATQEALLCAGCRNQVRNALVEWPSLYVQLSMALPKAQVSLSDKLSRGTPDGSAPVREGLLNLMDEASRHVEGWARELAMVVQVTLPHGRTGGMFQACCELLASRVDAAIERVDGGAWYGLSLIGMQARARHRLGLTSLVHRLSAPCPACDVKALLRHNGSDYVHCAICGARWPAEHYRFLARVLLDQAGNHL